MSKSFTRRFKLLAGLFLSAMKVSFDVALLKTTRNVQVQREQVVENPGNASLLSAATKSTLYVDRELIKNEAIPIIENVRQADVRKTSTFAYAFVIGGCDLNKPHYLGFIYNILVATRILREEGSTADVVAYFQISYRSNADTLPAEDIRLLSALGIRIKHIPKSESESFYETVLNKFHILALTEYKRVLLMDGDVMPVTNLDYLFELSVNGTLKENVVVSGYTEPANAGFFIVEPGESEYERIIVIIHKREVKAVGIQGHKFDVVNGWGHVITLKDPWKSRFETGTNWTFHFAFSDQGLLYYYTKYVKQSVSIVYGKNQVENWGTSESGRIHLEVTLDNPFDRLRKLRIKDRMSCAKFMCDFIHFTGGLKPWIKGPDKNITVSLVEDETPLHMWWHTLFKLNDELSMGLDFANWRSGRPSLGMYADFRQMNKRVMLRGTGEESQRHL